MNNNIIYLRTSTEEQNPELQLKDCQTINHYGEVEVIQDKQSAWSDKKERKGFEELRDLIKAGKVKNLIVWDWDRIYRNKKKFEEFLLFLKIYKVKLHSFRQQWFNDINKIPPPFDEIVETVMIKMFGYMAEEESSKKSDRVKNAVRKESGQVTKSYKGNRWGRKPIGKSVLTEVLDLHKQGKSIRQISRVVFYWDKNNNKRNLSIAGVHKIIKQNNLSLA